MELCNNEILGGYEDFLQELKKSNEFRRSYR